MYKNLLGENLQEQVTLGYGKEMWQKGYEEGLEIARKQLIDEEKARLEEEKYMKVLDGVLAASNISEEEKQKMRETFKKLSSE